MAALASAVVSALRRKVDVKRRSWCSEPVGIEDRCSVPTALIERQTFRRLLKEVQKILEDAGRRSMDELKELEEWLTTLKDTVYDVDDAFLQTRCIGSYHFPPFTYVGQIPPRMRLIIEALHTILNEGDKNCFMEVTDPPEEEKKDNPGLKKIIGRKIIRREEDTRDVMIHLLSGADSREQFPIISVVGVGGLGKTTFAGQLFEDEKVKLHFNLRMRVTVSAKKFVSLHIVREALMSVDGMGGIPDDFLENIFKEKIRGERFLLFLDNVWEGIDMAEWNKIKGLISGGAEGSRIMITTRTQEAAFELGAVATTIHRLRRLPFKDCKNLFEQEAFDSRKQNSRTVGLEKIGDQIVQKCHGVPLAVISLGRALRGQAKQTVWEDIRDRLWRDTENGTDKVLSVLKVSYDYLPMHLRYCFAYCSLLPDNCKIDVYQLIELWIAEGFNVEPSTGEEVDGVDCFNFLLSRFFFQDVTYIGPGRYTCRMHDMFHDLAAHVAGIECSAVEINESSRFAAVHCGAYELPQSFMDLTKAQKLRTIVVLAEEPRYKRPKCGIGNLSECFFLDHVFLRVLDLSCTQMTELPSAIGALTFLRYLNLSETMIESLPESVGDMQDLHTLKLELCLELQRLPRSISKLVNLETLDLNLCTALQDLPNDIGNMRSLKKIKIYECCSLKRMPAGIGKLKNLEYLSRFVLGENHDRDSSLSVLHDMDQLAGEIQIFELGRVKGINDARGAKLKDKHKLMSLELFWDGKGPATALSQELVDAEVVLEALQPHPNLERLKIVNYHGLRFPSWITGALAQSSLPKLIVIKLWNLSRCTSLPTLGKLPYLRDLWVSGLAAVRSIGLEFYGEEDVDNKDGTFFPSLKSLKIEEMPALERWLSPRHGSSDASLFPRLVDLRITECPLLETLLLMELPSLQTLHVTGQNTVEKILRDWQPPRTIKKLQLSRYDALPFPWEQPLQSLEDFQELVLYDSSEHSLPEGIRHLNSLNNLTLRNCNQLEGLPQWLGDLKSLQSIDICGCNALESFPDRAEGQFSSLRSLHISGLPYGIPTPTMFKKSNPLGPPLHLHPTGTKLPPQELLPLWMQPFEPYTSKWEDEQTHDSFDAMIPKIRISRPSRMVHVIESSPPHMNFFYIVGETS